MGKFDGILIATDLDGTLLRHDKSVSRENAEALDYFMSEGGLFTVLTGRMPYALSGVLSQVKVNAPVGCGNGLCVFDTAKKEHLWKTSVDRKVLDVVQFVQENFPDAGIEITTHEKILCVKTNASVMKHLSDEKLEHIECTLDGFDGEIAKILIAQTPEKLEPIINAINKSGLAEGFQCIRSDILYYEILPQGVGKGPLLIKLSSILDIPIEKIIAVGDNDNDESALLTAGLGIAVANASEIAKNASDLITVSNEEHALAKIVTDIENGIIKIN